MGRLPVMTKYDLTDNFDRVVTDGRVTREVCERYLEAPPGDYLLDQYRVVASGGSSGRRGVFVYAWDAWAVCWASMIRFPLRDWGSDPTLAGVARVAAVVAASKPSHVSAAFRHTFSTARTPEHVIPVGQPFEQIVAALNDLQPTELIGFSSMLARLAREAQTGRLHIRPDGCRPSPNRCCRRLGPPSNRLGTSPSELGLAPSRAVTPRKKSAMPDRPDQAGPAERVASHWRNAPEFRIAELRMGTRQRVD